MANLTANFMFKRDLEEAFLYHIKVLLSARIQDVKSQNVVKFFIKPPKKVEEKLLKYGCWCDAARIFRHDYTRCKNIEGQPYPSIIGKDPTGHGEHNVPVCPDIDDTVPAGLKDHNHRFGCFKPLESAKIFMDWFIEQEVRPDYRYRQSSYEEVRAVRKFVDEYARQVPVSETAEIDKNGKENMMLSLLEGFRGSDIAENLRKSPVAWEAERLLYFLRWNENKFKHCLNDLRSAMDKTVQLRLKSPTTSFGGGRSRREWERPRRSPAREQYEREEAPRRRYTREYSPWRGISPEEPYKGKSTQRRNPPEEPYRGEESTWRRNPLDERYYGGDERQWQGYSREIPTYNPPIEQHERGRDKSSRPKEQSGGGYKSRQPSPSRAKSRGGHRSRQPSPQKGVYESFLDRLPQEGRFPERVAGVFIDDYERRLTGDPPKGMLRRALVDLAVDELGRRIDNSLGIRDRGRSNTPPRAKSKVRVADPATGYGGGGSSSSRKRHRRRQYTENDWERYYLG